jgi:uncharacterized protein YjiS (DUF1127 family)
MTTVTTSARPTVAPTLALWTPLHRRAATLLWRAAHALHDSLTHRRRREAERALLSSLDARTLRDIGLGDWSMPQRAEDLRARWDGASGYRF